MVGLQQREALLGEGEGRCVLCWRVVFTLCLLGLALQGCQGFGRRGQGSQHRGQSDTSFRSRWAADLFSIHCISGGG